jgi:phosphoribosylanthranilate isomerase
MEQGHRTSSRVQVKICGITSEADAIAAAELGADALGFNFYRGSKRFVAIDAAAEWIRRLPGSVAKVAVLVNSSWNDALKIGRLPFIDALQLHGAESPDFCRKLIEKGVLVTKALPIKDERSLAQPTDYGSTRVLLDSGGEKFGGSGRTFPWSLARRFVEAHPELEVILAGGLTPDNVAGAIRIVQPFGVDVTSGIEADYGIKDRRLLEAFISSAHSA